MCTSFRVKDTEVEQGKIYGLPEAVVIADRFKANGETIDLPIYFEGCIDADVASQKWLPLGKWKRVDVYAKEYSHNGRWYEVPKGHCLYGIALETFNKAVVKILTRPARNLEEKVSDRFTKTGTKRFISCGYNF